MVRRLINALVLVGALAGAGWLLWQNRVTLVADILAHVSAHPALWVFAGSVLLLISVLVAFVLSHRARRQQRNLLDAMRVAEASVHRSTSTPPRAAAQPAQQRTLPDETVHPSPPPRGQPILSVIEGGRAEQIRPATPQEMAVPDEASLSSNLYFEPICDLATGALRGFDVVHKIRPVSAHAQPRFIRNLPRETATDRTRFEINTIDQALACARQAITGSGVLSAQDRIHVHASEALLDNRKAVGRITALIAANRALAAHLTLCFEGNVLAGNNRNRLVAIEMLADAGLALGASTPDFHPARLDQAVTSALTVVFFKPDDIDSAQADDPASGDQAAVLEWCRRFDIPLAARGLSSEASIIDAVASGARCGCGPAIARPVRLRRNTVALVRDNVALS